MNCEELQTRDQLATAYLEQLHALAHELDVAVGAVGANALPRFEESVWKQELLCANLAKMANALGGPAAEQPLPPCTDAKIEEKIHAAKGAIRDLNVRYAALLKHSGESVALLASLCRSHLGHFQEARGPRLKHQTWSCEV